MLPIVLVGLVSFGAGLGLAPELTRSLAAKEGPLEHLSHGLLGVGLVAWAIVAWRSRARSRSAAAAPTLALWCGLVLGEELDWGGVYGWVSGGGNLHNAWHGASYLLFSIPVLLVVGWGGWRRGGAPGRLPRRVDAIGLGVLGLCAVVGTVAWPEIEALLDEVTETILYAGVVWIALRPARGEDDQSSESSCASAAR